MKMYEKQVLIGALELTDSDLGTVFGGWEGEHHGGDHYDEDWNHHDWGDGGYLFFGYPGPSYYGGPSYYDGPSYYGRPGCNW